ncbi:MAG: flagellar motor switch protein FliN [Bryobacteraceae bacterium]
MPDNIPSAELWLTAEWVPSLSSVFETMTGESPSADTSPAGNLPAEEGLLWSQAFNGATGEFWVFAPTAAVAGSARLILQAAGMEDDDPETSKSTYLETANQALSSLAQAMAGKLEREVTPSAGSEQKSAPDGLRWVPITLRFSSGGVTLYAAASPELCAQFESASVQERVSGPPDSSGDEGSGNTALAKSKTFGLLLDVELPVSVSFGRAQVPLKEVLKLTTGSIVELNRSIAEPVEVIVNNCVIARGEVVVIEGNFGIRIQQVVSRQERLRTLH